MGQRSGNHAGRSLQPAASRLPDRQRRAASLASPAKSLRGCRLNSKTSPLGASMVPGTCAVRICRNTNYVAKVFMSCVSSMSACCVLWPCCAFEAQCMRRNCYRRLGESFAMFEAVHSSDGTVISLQSALQPLPPLYSRSPRASAVVRQLCGKPVSTRPAHHLLTVTDQRHRYPACQCWPPLNVGRVGRAVPGAPAAEGRARHADRHPAHANGDRDRPPQHAARGPPRSDACRSLAPDRDVESRWRHRTCLASSPDCQTNFVRSCPAQERPSHPNPVIQEVLRSSKSNLPGFQKVRSALVESGCPVSRRISA